MDIGDSFLEGLAQLRECYMRKAGFGKSTPLRIEETGYPTGPGRTEAAQVRATREFVRTAVAYRGTYGISDFRWFGLRDNNSEGPNFQSFFGLLRDDYTPKPAFGVYRKLIAAVRALSARRAGADHPRGGRREHAARPLELGERVAQRGLDLWTAPLALLLGQADQLAGRADRGHECSRWWRRSSTPAWSASTSST